MDREQFISTLVPGNYYLTKSMELSRIQTSGTLWYTKKFLVLYYYIFLADNITVVDTVSEICDIFDNYIESLPANLRQAASGFFYSSKPVANLKSPDFRLFDDFVGNRRFANNQARIDFIEMAKKYYFAFLMESGGQSGVKAEIKRHLYEQDFTFTQIDSIVDNYFKLHPQSYNLTAIKNDYMAFLRNERQILFYYGFFHSKSNGSQDVEFSSLTPIGELALRSNFYEFIAIWEHQKFKMISQPVTVDIQNVDGSNRHYNPDDFEININPYFTILQSLAELGEITADVYQYVISRLRKYPADGLNVDKAFIDSIIHKVKSFNRKGDLKSEDFQKELKKYLLGIRDDLPIDDGKNPLGLCSLAGKGRTQLNDRGKLDSLIELYSSLSAYKEKKYKKLFEECNAELKRQYFEKLANRRYVIDSQIKVDWDMYNIHIDLPIILVTMTLTVCTTIGKKASESNISKFLPPMRELFPNLLSGIGLSGKLILKKELKNLFAALSSKDFKEYLVFNADDYDVSRAAYLGQSLSDLDAKIKEVSNLPSVIEDGVRKRNSTLIHLIKSYNIQRFAQDQPLKCECCGNTTFLTHNDEAYMEYHHLIPFREYDGADHYLNIVALCPMCHRKIHHLKKVEKETLYRDISSNNYLQMTLVDRLIQLKKDRKLKSYQLEFLLADKAISTDAYNQIIQAS